MANSASIRKGQMGVGGQSDRPLQGRQRAFKHSSPKSITPPAVIPGPDLASRRGSIAGATARCTSARYRSLPQNKRAAALLDFDDLIFAARDLLRDHEPVREALAARYRHVLVDEFQDTDPRQTEIFWRLCGDATARQRAATGRAGASGLVRSF